MATENPYRLADLTISLLNRQSAQRARKTKNKLTVLKFDEANVLKETDSLYSWLDQNNRKKYGELFIERYKELNGKRKGDAIEELMEMRLAGLLDEPNEVTHYTYASEVLRKRDKLKEAIFAVPTRVQKQMEIDKAIRYFLQQTAFYVDLVSDDATLCALKDNGVKKVIWNTQDDGRVCKDCRDKDGKIYLIDNVPVKPHPRCRCYIVPI